MDMPTSLTVWYLDNTYLLITIYNDIIVLRGVYLASHNHIPGKSQSSQGDVFFDLYWIFVISTFTNCVYYVR